MLRTAGALLSGARAALAAPGWIEGPRLSELMAPAPAARAGAAPPRGAVRAALTGVRWLARVPRSPWRNTCLYRSVAECLVLRRYAVGAVVRIGVRSDEGEIGAHAWVERADGRPAASAPSADAHQTLSLRA